MNWTDLEQYIFDEGCLAIPEIVPALSNEIVLAFCFQCMSSDGLISPCVNTKEGLARTVAKYKANLGFAHRSEAELTEQLAWNPGDWSHKNLAMTRFHDDRGYLKHCESRLEEEEQANPGADNFSKLHEEYELFMQAVARALVRLEADNRFAAFNRAADFFVACVDYCECLHDGLARIERARKELQSPNSVA
jgi:Domain of unknown function (DUF4303)